MKKNINAILIILLIISIAALPYVVFSIKFHTKKTALHIGTKRYNEVNYVCFEEKIPDGCLAFLQEDIKILADAHNANKKALKQPASLKKPIETARLFYKKFENSSGIEPEIMLKTMMIKQILLKDLKDPVSSGVFGEEMENYIINNFSEPNRSNYVKILKNQDENLNETFEKSKNEKNSKSLTSAYKG